MLVHANAYRLRVELHELCKRVLQPASQRRGSDGMYIQPAFRPSRSLAYRIYGCAGLAHHTNTHARAAKLFMHELNCVL